LPGSLEEKVNPYLRPLYDALHDMLDYNRVRKLIEQDIIEVAPLAFMRGRTLNDCFVILDEAQNSTGEQMKMFLTRLGFGSKAVITGDITQSDLPATVRSGLREAVEVLGHVDDIHISYFTEADVVRHPLVQEIIRAYDKWDQRKQQAEQGRYRGDRRGPRRRDADESSLDSDPSGSTDPSDPSGSSDPSGGTR
jgi:phosphate starvation-inducible PhoH-like protein